MKKIGMFGTLVLAAGITTTVVTNLPNEVEDTKAVKEIINALQIGEFRIAIADRPCPLEDQAGWAYLNEQCVKWVTRADYCFCATRNEDQLTGELDPAEVPDAVFRMVGVCEHEHEGKTIQSVEWAPVGSSEPPGYDCKLIAARILNWRISHRATLSQYVRALKNKCCAACPDGCWIDNDNHGQCPFCLLDSTPGCDTYCLSP